MDRSIRQLDHRSGRAARQTSAVLIKDPPQIHFQRRVCDSEDFALELAEPIGFGDGVGALKTGVQKPYLGAFGDVIVAAFLNLGETVVADDLYTQERTRRGGSSKLNCSRSRRRFSHSFRSSSE